MGPWVPCPMFPRPLGPRSRGSWAVGAPVPWVPGLWARANANAGVNKNHHIAIKITPYMPPPLWRAKVSVETKRFLSK